MSSTCKRFRRTWTAWVAGVLVAALSAGCGGGGGDSDVDEGPPGTIDLSLANRDTVAHAGVAAALGLGGADQALTVSGASARVQREVAQTVSSLRTRSLGVIGPIDEPCLVSGLTRMSIDDRNNNGVADIDEPVTLQFVQCRDSLDDTVDGTIRITLSQVTASGFVGSVSLNALTVVRDGGAQQHSIRLDGPMQMSFADSSPALATFRLTASAPVTVTAVTPVFADTVTLHAGFVQEAEVDIAAAPPSGGTTPGRSSTRSAGRISSQVAGGEMTLYATVPLVQYADDPFPREGAVGIVGRNGSIAIHPLSAEQVRIDLDSNGDGVVDATTTQRWDWLI